jgi:hypothetical protein
MRVRTSFHEAFAMLAAMRDVASLGQSLSAADRVSLLAAGRWMFALDGPLDVDHLPTADPVRLAATLVDPELRQEAARFLTVMAFVDGTLDAAKVARVLDHAAALGVQASYIDEIAAAATGSLDWALAHMVRDNMASITGRPWSGDVVAWMQPYQGAHADAALAARYRDLVALPEGSFGRSFIAFDEQNGYAVPGDAKALNARFATPHDATHVISGYDTTPRGELLVSTFTAAMHPRHPISGHVLPVIFAWHLGIKINDVAGSAVGAMDPAGFWHAWARGEQMKVDLFIRSASILSSS